MELFGADVFVKSEAIPKLPETSGPFKLIFISNRGTRVYPPPAPAISLLDVSQCRYLSESPVEDEAIETLLSEISGGGFHWSKAQKLYKKDGVDQFSQPY